MAARSICFFYSPQIIALKTHREIKIAKTETQINKLQKKFRVHKDHAEDKRILFKKLISLEKAKNKTLY